MSQTYSITHSLTGRLFRPYLVCLWIDLDVIYGFATYLESNKEAISDGNKISGIGF